MLRLPFIMLRLLLRPTDIMQLPDRAITRRAGAAMAMDGAVAVGGAEAGDGAVAAATIKRLRDNTPVWMVLRKGGTISFSAIRHPYLLSKQQHSFIFQDKKLKIPVCSQS